MVSAATSKKAKRVTVRATSSYLKSTVDHRLVLLHRHQVVQSQLENQLPLENLLLQNKANQEPKKKKRLKTNLLPKRTLDASEKWRKLSVPGQRLKHNLRGLIPISCSG